MEKFIRVDDWIPEDDDYLVGYDGKLMLVAFNKLFNRDEAKDVGRFVIKKESYVKKLDKITLYTNYFLKYYDLEKELLLSYFKLKYVIDDKRKKVTTESYIQIMYKILFTDTLIAKIEKMVEDNYYIELNSEPKKKYSETLQIVEDHAKLLMKISVAINLMVPVVFHFINAKSTLKGVGRVKEDLFPYYEPLFSLFDDDILIYNKLLISTMAKVNKNRGGNHTSWDQREIFGMDSLIFMDKLLKDNIISETLFKYRFHKNIVNFNSVILDEQLRFFLIEKYDYSLVELSDEKDADGMSGLDKMEMNSNKIDESLVILSDINITQTIKRLRNSMNIIISPEEVKFYKKNFKYNSFQVGLINYYFAKHFGGFRDLGAINKNSLITLLIILKRRLQVNGFVFIPQLLTGNIQNKLNTRTIQNSKFLEKVESSTVYQSLIDDKFAALKEIGKEDMILNILSTILNTTFTYVDYDLAEDLGEKIEIVPDVVCYEFLHFLSLI